MKSFFLKILEFLIKNEIKKHHLYPFTHRLQWRWILINALLLSSHIMLASAIFITITLVFLGYYYHLTIDKWLIMSSQLIAMISLLIWQIKYDNKEYKEVKGQIAKVVL